MNHNPKIAAELSPGNLAIKIAAGLVVLAIVMAICSLFGSQPISIAGVLDGPAVKPQVNIDYDIYMRVRLPRAVLAALIGAALASAGVTLQAILRNPLAEPYILGISSGSALGVVIAILSGVNWVLWAGSPITLFAFAGALAAVWLVWLVSSFAGGSQITTLLLAGVVVNAFLSAVIMFLTSVIDNQQLRTTVYWLMGNIGEKAFPVLGLSAALVVPGIAGLYLISHRLNVLSFGREQALSMGVAVDKVRLLAFGLAAFITAVAVALGGLIGFVGLIVPHAVRLVFGPDHRQLLPLSALAGAAFLVMADTIARIIISPEQLPVGVITAIAGGPFFLLLLAKYGKKTTWLK